MLRNIHHLALIVENMEDSIRMFADAFGMQVKERRDHQAEGALMDIALIPIGDAMIELVQVKEGALQDAPRVGFWHVAFKVDNIVEAMTEVQKGGVKPTKPEPYQGVDWQIAFLDTKTTSGLPLQLVEDHKR